MKLNSDKIAEKVEENPALYMVTSAVLMAGLGKLIIAVGNYRVNSVNVKLTKLDMKRYSKLTK